MVEEEVEGACTWEEGVEQVTLRSSLASSICVGYKSACIFSSTVIDTVPQPKTSVAPQLGACRIAADRVGNLESAGTASVDRVAGLPLVLLGVFER